jgi:hypothetical protein
MRRVKEALEHAAGSKRRLWHMPSSNVRRTDKAGPRLFIRTTPTAAGADGWVLRDHAILNVEDVVACGEWLHAVCEAAIACHVDISGEHRATARTRSGVVAVLCSADFGAIRRVGAHDLHREKDRMPVQFIDRASDPTLHVLLVHGRAWRERHR